MSKSDLEKMIFHGEGARLEFKHRLPQSERIAREVTALANTHGGHLLIGVTDDGKLSGVKDPEEELFALNRALQKHCTPILGWSHKLVKVSRTRMVVALKIPASPNRPHYVQKLGCRTKSVYVRFEDMCIEASREACKLMHTFTDTKNVLIHLGDKERLLLKYLDQMGEITVKGFSKSAKIHPGRASRMIIRMTRAGILHHHIDPNVDYFTAGVGLSSSRSNSRSQSDH